MNAYIFFENGIIAVRAGPEAAPALKGIADDVASRLNELKDLWDQGDFLLTEAQAVIDLASAFDNSLDSVVAVGSLAFGIGLGIAVGGVGVAGVVGVFIIGVAGDYLYTKAAESAKNIGSQAGEALFDLIPPGTIDAAANNAWNAAINWRPAGRDPLAIDLDGDGIETVGIGSTPTLFDHGADGIKTGTGWLKGDDAWLVRDIDGNGTIDTGRELFGVDTLIETTTTVDGAQYNVTRTASTGFEALQGQMLHEALKYFPCRSSCEKRAASSIKTHAKIN